MANPERRGKAETIIHYGNYIDAGVILLGLVTFNPKLLLLGAAGFGGGKITERYLKKRREKKG